MLRFLTAGESHGRALVGIIEGMVAGVRISKEEIDRELKLRKRAWGRGKRASFEEDRVEILSGVIEGLTIGSPISLMIRNREKKLDTGTVPRPGHADLPGVIKYGFKNIHLVAERASARETAMRVAIGSIAKQFLLNFGIEFFSHTLAIGGVEAEVELDDFTSETRKARDGSDLFCLDNEATSKIKERIGEAEEEGDTLGGVCEVLAKGLPPGIGSYVHYDRRLDCRLVGALMSIPSVKAVEIGEGILGSRVSGSQFHDALYYEEGMRRRTNNAGGIEGGVSNGEMIRLRLFVKPIPTLRKGISSFDMVTKEETKAPYIRSDTCVVPSVGIIGEAVVAWEIACLFLEKFGGDSLSELRDNYNNFLKKRLNDL
ncbi:MAG: chorismate synthase [Acidobacteria bacterium]|nr:chorismate synthase [Acidobacteriota bacterium]